MPVQGYSTHSIDCILNVMLLPVLNMMLHCVNLGKKLIFCSNKSVYAQNVLFSIWELYEGHIEHMENLKYIFKKETIKKRCSLANFDV